jgi:hypothetical protein
MGRHAFSIDETKSGQDECTGADRAEPLGCASAARHPALQGGLGEYRMQGRGLGGACDQKRVHLVGTDFESARV